MSKIAAYLFILSFSVQSLYSIDTNAVKYFPLNIGNVYVYAYHDYSGTTYSKTTIVKDSVFNNHRYFLFREEPYVYEVWKRVDSVTNNIMKYDASNSCPYYNYENFVDSLLARLGDAQKGACNTSVYGCSDTNYVNIFGIQSQLKGFHFSSTNITMKHYYAKNIGFYRHWTWTTVSSYDETLAGCILNGVVYGDTAMALGITKISSEVPGYFTLYQNYPNPFNPTTLIKYSVWKESYVILKIYSISGEEVSEPVSQLQQPGTYSIVFNASAYSSGVYFYRMEAYDFNGDALFSESRKMLLVK